MGKADWILYRYSTWGPRERAHIDLLRMLNPKTSITGLWHGGVPSPDHIRTFVHRGELDTQLKAWYRSVGMRDVSWNRLLLVSSDTLFTASLESLYGPAEETVFLPGASVATQVCHPHKDWMQAELETMRGLAHRLGLRGKLQACVPVAGAFPREFLFMLESLHYPSVGPLSLRLPLLVRLSKCKLRSAPVCAPGTDMADRFFGWGNASLQRHDVEQELARPCGRTAFYPYDGEIDWLLEKIRLTQQTCSWPG